MADKLKALREWMGRVGIDWYYVTTADYHQSEYTCGFFKLREYLTGFTGSNGSLLVSADMAGLWTDGRYFIQAERELSGSGVALFKMQEEGVPTIREYLKEHLREGNVLGFDGRTVSALDGLALEKIAEENGACVHYEADCAQELWKGRPPLPAGPVRMLTQEEAGQTTADKLKAVRQAMREKDCHLHLLAGLSDIMWLFNLRGEDVPCNPVALSYCVIGQEDVWLFTRTKAVLPGVHCLPYEEIFGFLEAHREGFTGKRLLYDGGTVNYRLYRTLEADCIMVEGQNPTLYLKAVKNETELAHTREAHRKDGVAFTRFMIAIKRLVKERPVTETEAARLLEGFRKEQDGYLQPSFETIAAYGPNAAMMHYQAVPGKESVLRQEGLFLVDSGGQYTDGTTDITRTLALGEVPAEQKRHVTAVVRAMLRLSEAVFLEGCTGRNLDILARGVLWEQHMDYKCGTGHGVGHMLSVHEGPQAFRWRQPEGMPDAVLTEGMVITDEPGIYKEGSHGIRIENELVCKKDIKNGDGQFMRFETLTLAPIDLEAMDISLLTAQDKAWLNAYHSRVREKLAPYLPKEEREELNDITREIL